jgi:SAM-dependent methyltransferase
VQLVSVPNPRAAPDQAPPISASVHSHSTDFLQTAITAPKLLITDFKSYRDRAFAKFELAVSKKFAEDVPVTFDPILATSRGVVLDVGPGAGYQLFRFSHPENITAIYGVEPGVDMHAALQEQAKKAGLGEKYKILLCGAEPESLIPALAREGLLGKEKSLADGLFDEIVCIRVLCSVPKLNETVDGLYRCLKPGGRLVVCEHVVSDDIKGGSKVRRFLQHLYMALGWSFWLGGCQLTRDTTAVLMKAAEADGGWSEVRLEKAYEWSVIPHIVGYCTKKS